MCFCVSYQVYDSLPFRKNHNTTQPVIHFLDKIYKNLNSNEPKFTIAIFLDLKKAFDTTCHTILLDKLEHYGFRGISLDWFKNYLRERQQVVCVNSTISSSRNITVGVPQGSIFSFFDFHQLSPKLCFQMSDRSLKDLFINANKELEKASEWFTSNKLTLNVSKTKFIIFKPKNCRENPNNFTLKIGNESIERIGEDLPLKSFKFVGLVIDENLSWKYCRTTKLSYLKKLSTPQTRFEYVVLSNIMCTECVST